MTKKNETQHSSSVVNLARALLWMCALSTPAIAQLGTLVGQPIEVELITGNTACNAVEYAWGSYWIGAGPIIPGGPDKIYEVSTDGMLRSTTDSCLPPVMTGATDFAADEDAQARPADPALRVHERLSASSASGSSRWRLRPVRSPATPSGHFFATWAPLRSPVHDRPDHLRAHRGEYPADQRQVRARPVRDEVNGTLWAFCAENPIGAEQPVEVQPDRPDNGSAHTAALHGRRHAAPPNLAGGDIFHDVRILASSIVGCTGPRRTSYDLLARRALRVQVTWWTIAVKTNSVGCVPAIVSTGAPSATAGTGFMVQGINVRNNKSGLLFYSLTGRNNALFQLGTLCVKAPVRRTPATGSGGNPLPVQDCSGIYGADMNAFAVGALGGSPHAALTVPGTLVNCQWWGRDPGFLAPNNTTLSNALEYVICP
jgi:hypothetical protein